MGLRRGIIIKNNKIEGAYNFSTFGTFAAFVEADELAEDLLVLLADGLTEERLVALLKRWSKAWTRKPSGGPKGMDQLD